MTVTYITDEDIIDKLYDEYLEVQPRPKGYTQWLRDVRIPYAVKIKYCSGTMFGHIITFKEEKDLTYFLLTL